jgi:hypothetical protein
MIINIDKIAGMNEEELLNQQICKLNLTIKGTKIEKAIQKLYKELDDRNIEFKPPCYLTDEWFSPEGIPAIGIPFYLTHPRLIQLERKMMLKVEGETEKWCMKLLRHETGHAINHAYKLYRKTRWRELFGSAHLKQYSPSNYSVHPYSKRYVIHLDNHYAQAHPEEDFAETFAVWINPENNWQVKYQDWPALKKLNYVNRLIRNIARQEPLVTSTKRPFSASRMRSTLANYYNRRKKLLEKDLPDYYDRALLQLFTNSDSNSVKKEASHFLISHKDKIINTVSHWSGIRKYDINEVIKKLIGRCKEMQLYTTSDDTMNITAFIATHILQNTQLYDYEEKL